MSDDKAFSKNRVYLLRTHVENTLRARIENGAYPAGSLLPGRRALCEELEVAPLTLDKAIKSLLADGSLRTEAGRGTFVTDATPRPATASNAEPPESFRRRPADAAAYRIGIIDTDTNVSMIHPTQHLHVYMIVHAAEHQISKMGSHAVYSEFGPIYENQEICTQIVDNLLDKGVDAVLMTDYHEHPQAVSSLLQYAQQVRMPLVLASSSSRDWPVPHVWTDNRVAGRQAADHLIRQGYEQILFLAPFEREWQEQRILGAQDAVREAGLPQERLTIVRLRAGESLGDEKECGAWLLERVYHKHMRFPAVIGANDWVALAALRKAQELGLSPGVQIGFIGFDDNLTARQNNLTTVQFPLETLGTEAALLALRAAAGERMEHRIRIGCNIIARASTSHSAFAPPPEPAGAIS